MSSSTSLPSSSTSTFQFIFDSALREYTQQTGVDLTTYDFANQPERCRSPDEVILVIRGKAKKFKEYRDGNRKLISGITPVVQVVHVFAGFLGEATSIVPTSSPGKAIFAGIDVLLSAAIGVSNSYDALADLFACVGNFLMRLSVYEDILDMPPADGMLDMLVKIITEVLSVLALATKQIKQGRVKKFAKVLFKNGGDVEAVLQRLDRLTTDEARMTVTQTLKIVYGLVNNVKLVMDNGNASMHGIREALVSMQDTASLVNKIRRDQLQDNVRSWVSPPDPSTNQNIIYESFQVGTGSWFFDGDVFAEWKAKGPILWIHGKPGSGKSTLLSSIIQDLDADRAAGLASVVYYYFDFRDADKQNRQGLLSSLLLQLASESDRCYEILSHLYTTHSRGTRKPNDPALIHCLKDMLGQHRQATYVIIDAIDECPNLSGSPTPREEVLEFLEGLIDMQFPHLRICIASRPEADIRGTLEPLTSLRVSLHEQSGQRKDILDYVTKVVRTDKEMRKWREEDKLLVINYLAEKSDGMFQWARCQLASEVTRSELKRQLSVSVCVQTERDEELGDVQTRLRVTQARLDELLLSRDQQIGKSERELASVRAKLEANESELEAVRLRLADAEKGWTSLDELVVSHDQQVGQHEGELEAVRLRLADAEKGWTSLDELVVSHDQQVGQLEKELTDMRAKLEAKDSELEAVRLRLTDAEKVLTKSKAEADTLSAHKIPDSRNCSNRDEDQVIRGLMERMQAIEDEMARGSKRWNEKSIADMVSRNEG